MKRKTKRVFLMAPEGVKVKRHHIGGDDNEIRFTIMADGFQKLVGVAKNNVFTWICKGFRNR